MSALRDAFGDLAITIRELERTPAPEYTQSRGETFRRWFAFGEPFFHQAIATMALASESKPTHEDLAPLREAVQESYKFHQLGESAYAAFQYIGYELGYFYGGAPWRSLCSWRSAFTFVNEMVPDTPVDLEWTEDMDQWAHELFTEMRDIPAGIPAHHWWWFRAAP